MGGDGEDDEWGPASEEDHGEIVADSNAGVACSNGKEIADNGRENRKLNGQNGNQGDL